jgi:hypothetical protein
MAAWNALMASYTFLRLTAPEQHLVLGRVRDIVETQLGRTVEDLMNRNGRIVFLNFLVYGLGEEGIKPALGDQTWFWIKNPFVGCIGAEEVLDNLKRQLERKHGVHFDIEF